MRKPGDRTFDTNGINGSTEKANVIRPIGRKNFISHVLGRARASLAGRRGFLLFYVNFFHELKDRLRAEGLIADGANVGAGGFTRGDFTLARGQQDGRDVLWPRGLGPR